MTLIAGFKCGDGFVICADSQETVTRDGYDQRVTRQKLVRIALGIGVEVEDFPFERAKTQFCRARNEHLVEVDLEPFRDPFPELVVAVLGAIKDLRCAVKAAPTTKIKERHIIQCCDELSKEFFHAY